MPSDTTISKFYNYKAIKPYIGLEGRIPVRNKDVYVGIEVELEGVTGSYELSSKHIVEDHSLKINGIEFVTIPLKMRYLEVELQRLFGGITSGSPLVSTRCSTHVHVNVRDMTIKQILALVMIYMMFERGLYRLSGDRWNSNFCVPLTMATSMVKNFFKSWTSNSTWAWYKYTGLNISPIWGGESSTIGTVEFRQLHGTTSVEEIIQWCNMITSIKRAAQAFDLEELLVHIRTMNTTSGYAWLAKEVFGPYSKLLTNQPTFIEDMEKCVTILKSCIPDEYLGYMKKVKPLGKDIDNVDLFNVFSAELSLNGVEQLCVD